MYLSFVKYLFIYGTPEPTCDTHFLYDAIFPSLLLLIFGRHSSQQDIKKTLLPEPSTHAAEHTHSSVTHPEILKHCSQAKHVPKLPNESLGNWT